MGMTYTDSSCADGLKNSVAAHPNVVIGMTRVELSMRRPPVETTQWQYGCHKLWHDQLYVSMD
jgi:hypothetical protein